MAQSQTPLSSSPAKVAAPRGLGALLSRFSPSGAFARFRTGLALGFCLLLSLLVALALFRFVAPPLSARAMDLAQVGRNIATGKGFSTSVILPFAAPLSEGRTFFPDFLHEPLFPFATALAFTALPSSDSAVIALSLVFFVASAGLLFSLSLRLSNGNFAVAISSVAVYILSSSVLGLASSGTPATLSTALLLLLLLLLTPPLPKAAPPATSGGQAPTAKKKKARQDSPRRQQIRLARRFGWAGAVLGLCYLSNYVLLLPALVLAIMWVSQQTDGWNRERAQRFILAFVIVCLPWWFRNFRLAGNPFYTLQWFEVAMQTRAFPGHSLFSSFEQGEIGSLVALGPGLGDVVRKTLRGLQDYFHLLPQVANPYLMPFVLVGLGLRSRFLQVERCRVKTGLVMALLLLIFVLSLLGRRDASFLAPLVPLLCFVGASALVELFTLWQEQGAGRDASDDGRASWSRSGARAFKRARTGAILALLALLIFPLAPVVSAVVKRRNARAVSPRVAALKQLGGEQMKRALPLKRAIVTDVPEEVAWYSARPAVLVPSTVSQLADIEKIQPLSSLFLSKATASSKGGIPPEWKGIYQGRTQLKGYVKNAVSQEGDILYLREPTVAEARELARKNPRDAGAQFSLAFAQLSANRPAEAQVAFTSGLRLNSKNSLGLLGRGTANLRTRDFQGALRDFQAALALAPRSLSAQMGIGDSLLALGQNARALVAYESVLADYPDQLTAINNLAYLYAQQGQDLRRSLQMARRAAQLSPDNLEVQDTLGWACSRTGRLDEAAAILSRVVKARPDNGLSQYHLGKTLLALDKKEEGYAIIQKALALTLPAAERADAQRVIAAR